MQYRCLGRTGLDVSILGLGSGGTNRLGQAQQARTQDVGRFVQHALGLGINFIDTAPGYGDSESLLGEALQGVPRESYVLCTKFNANRGNPPAGALRHSLEESLRRLRTDYVDVMYLHAVYPHTYTSTLDAFLEELLQAQRDGLTRFLGITEAYEFDPSHAAMQRALDNDLFDVIMIGHNLISPSGLVHVMPRAEGRRTGVVIMCAIRSVISNPEHLRNTLREWKSDGALSQDALPDDAPLDWVLGPGVETVTDAGYKFAAESPAVSSVLTGTANTVHLEANVRAILGPPLPRAASQRLQDIFIPANRSVVPPGFRVPPPSL